VRPIVYIALIDIIVTSISISSIIAIGMILIVIAGFEFIARLLSDRLMRKFESRLGLETGGNIWNRLVGSNSMALKIGGVPLRDR
jgi:ABC-type bacteriocin/lantibiotic exporter with double-glycine peptidase domain